MILRSPQSIIFKVFIFIFSVWLLSTCGSKYEMKGEFIGGFASVKLGGKFGIIDESGKEIVNPRYDEVGNFVGDFAKVRMNDKFGLINKQGVEVITPKYEKIYGFNGEFAKVMLNGKFGMIDKKAKEVLEAKYEAVNYNMIGKYFEVSENGNVTRVEYKAEK